MNDYDFKATFIKRLSQKKWDDFEKAMRTLLKDAVAEYKGDKRQIIDNAYLYGGKPVILPHVNDSDYCNAFGILQGVAYYGLGYKCLGADNVEGTPKNWIRELEREIGAVAYEYHVKINAKA